MWFSKSNQKRSKNISQTHLINISKIILSLNLKKNFSVQNIVLKKQIRSEKNAITYVTKNMYVLLLKKKNVRKYLEGVERNSDKLGKF